MNVRIIYAEIDNACLARRDLILLIWIFHLKTNQLKLKNTHQSYQSLLIKV
ncbi:hypothetical protein PTE_03374, partial [Photorhabdus khanii NC19]